MNNGLNQPDRRATRRTPYAGRIWWLGECQENFRAGWSADRSTGGLAFVTAAGARLVVGQTLTVSRVHPRKHPAACETLRICRVEPYGGSLELVACARPA